MRWTSGPVVYLGLNVQGSNDNYPYAGVDGETRSDQEIQRQRNEEIARKAANLHWLSEGFDFAKRTGAKGVLIVWQADPNFTTSRSSRTRAHTTRMRITSTRFAPRRWLSPARSHSSTATATTSRSTSP